MQKNRKTEVRRVQMHGILASTAMQEANHRFSNTALEKLLSRPLELLHNQEPQALHKTSSINNKFLMILFGP